MNRVRRVSQLFFLTFFIFLFFKTTFPYESLIPVDLFLRASPLVALATMISSRELISSVLLIAAIVLVFSILVGRYFCGWVCPLGTCIDISDRLHRLPRKNPNKSYRKYRVFKYTILAITLFAAVFSLQLIWFVDPISLITRSFTVGVFPVFAFFVEGLLSFFIKAGLFEDTIFSIYDSLRGTIIPVEPLIFKQGVFILLVFVIILLLGRFARRFWCRYLCPLGALFALVSKFRLSKRIVTDKCISCGKCYRECKMDAISEDFQSFSHAECIECMNCVAVCPTDAFNYSLKLKPTPEKIDFSRRRFILSGLTGLLAAGVTKTAFADKEKTGVFIRPPGSIPENEFLDRCIRCHECIKICSTTGKYLQPALLESGWEGLLTPIGYPRLGYCEYECVLCGKVCPTGAIHELTVEQKKKMPLGTAKFDKSRCIPWYKDEDCLVCEEHCPVADKAIKFDIRAVETHDGTIREIKYPYVDEDLCVGCGICVTKCPLYGKAGIFLTAYRQERWVE